MLIAQLPLGVSGHDRMRGNDAHGKVVDHVLDEFALCRKIRLVGKRAAKFLQLVVVPRNDEVAQLKLREDFAQVLVCRRISPVGEVAGDHDGIGSRVQDD